RHVSTNDYSDEDSRAGRTKPLLRGWTGPCATRLAHRGRQLGPLWRRRWPRPFQLVFLGELLSFLLLFLLHEVSAFLRQLFRLLLRGIPIVLGNLFLLLLWLP